MDKEQFYNEVENILHSGHEYREAWVNPRRSGRWNSRAPGNGRFQGFGLIRWFGPTKIHVALHYPVKVNRCYNHPYLALADLIYLTIDHWYKDSE